MSTTSQAEDNSFEFFRYKISIPAAVVFIALFAILTAVHTFQAWKSRNWICICLAFGALCEVQSYAVRILSANEAPDYSLGIYIAQATGALIAPAFFAANIYVCFGRTILSVDGEKLSPIRVSWLTVFFVIGDVAGLAIQCVGAIFMPMGTYEKYKLGSNIVIGGLALLLFYISLFIIVAITFHIRIIRHPTQLSSLSSKKWQKNLFVLYANSLLILVRSVYRLIEYSGGNDSVLMRNEWTLYVLDAVLMFILLVVFAIWQPMQKGTKEDVAIEGSEIGLTTWRKRVHGESVSSQDIANLERGKV